MKQDNLKQQIRRQQISDILLLAIVALAIFAFFCCIFSANAQEAKKPPMPDTIKEATTKPQHHCQRQADYHAAAEAQHSPRH